MQRSVGQETKRRQRDRSRFGAENARTQRNAPPPGVDGLNHLDVRKSALRSNDQNYGPFTGLRFAQTGLNRAAWVGHKQTTGCRKI